VREEILYREGAALGLDRDDIVVKRRVRQKLEVMEEELHPQPPRPTPSCRHISRRTRPGSRSRRS
jgi:hypothetical protein